MAGEFWGASWIVEDADYSDSDIVEVALSASLLSSETSDAPWRVYMRVHLPRNDERSLDERDDEAISKAKEMLRHLVT